MDNIFTPENKSIEKILGYTDSFYKIPIYQRPYSWDRERVEQLWYDVLEAYKNNNDDENIDPNYFLGSVVVVKKPDDDYEVVDGQQRLTTLIILFCTLRDIKNLEDLEFHMGEEEEKMILNSIKSCG